MKRLLLIATVFMPWPIRLWLLHKAFGYRIHPTARLGFAWVFPNKLVMEAGSTIDHLTVVKGLDLLHLKEKAYIGRANWITAFPLNSKSGHFAHVEGRRPQLLVGEHAAITNRHLIDCTDSVSIGKYSILGGFQSQLLTHSIDVRESRQSCSPIDIGSFCFIGTNCVMLGGSSLPDYCVLGAKSLLNKQYKEPYHLYAGAPALPVKQVDQSLKFFSRQEGFVI